MLKHINTTSAAPPFGSYSLAVQIPPGARTLYVSGQVGAHPDGSVPTDVTEQVRLMFANLQLVLADANMSLRDIVHMNYYVCDAEDLPAVRQMRDALFKPPFPAASLVLVKALGRTEWRVEIDCVAAKVDGGPV